MVSVDARRVPRLPKPCGGAALDRVRVCLLQGMQSCPAHADAPHLRAAGCSTAGAWGVPPERAASLLRVEGSGCGGEGAAQAAGGACGSAVGGWGALMVATARDHGGRAGHARASAPLCTHCHLPLTLSWWCCCTRQLGGWRWARAGVVARRCDAQQLLLAVVCSALLAQWSMTWGGKRMGVCVAAARHLPLPLSPPLPALHSLLIHAHHHTNGLLHSAGPPAALRAGGIRAALCCGTCRACRADQPVAQRLHSPGQWHGCSSSSSRGTRSSRRSSCRGTPRSSRTGSSTPTWEATSRPPAPRPSWSGALLRCWARGMGLPPPATLVAGLHAAASAATTQLLLLLLLPCRACGSSLRASRDGGGSARCSAALPGCTHAPSSALASGPRPGGCVSTRQCEMPALAF